mmetsp:Transcript_10976/g.23071  ORF Transcript_10976/g.23071 Transcript_10976/m.23071 type:complete len:258 (+) Transcript_10976:235-1008(+)
MGPPLRVLLLGVVDGKRRTCWHHGQLRLRSLAIDVETWPPRCAQCSDKAFRRAAPYAEEDAPARGEEVHHGEVRVRRCDTQEDWACLKWIQGPDGEGEGMLVRWCKKHPTGPICHPEHVPLQESVRGSRCECVRRFGHDAFLNDLIDGGLHQIRQCGDGLRHCGRRLCGALLLLRDEPLLQKLLDFGLLLHVLLEELRPLITPDGSTGRRQQPRRHLRKWRLGAERIRCVAVVEVTDDTQGGGRLPDSRATTRQAHL